MELRKFISQTLIDIIAAVEDAQKAVSAGVVVPKVNRNVSMVELGISEYQSIDFEVTVKADEREGSEAKLNVVAAIVGGGIKGESSKSDEHAATLKFRIPIRLPSS